MIKRTIAACMTAAIAVSYSSKLHAEEAFIAPLVEQSVLLDVDAGNFVVIVGERGHILISEDGKSFKQVRTIVTRTFGGIYQHVTRFCARKF